MISSNSLSLLFDGDYNFGDMITALEYNESGEFLATGSRSGQISILNVDNSTNFRFQSHEPEFDSLKSVEIGSKINQVKFCGPHGKNNFILSANDQTIKLWKIGSRKCYVPQAVSSLKSSQSLRLPKKQLSYMDSEIVRHYAFEKHKYAGAHAYHINSLAVNSDNETFLSADDLRINWWNLNNSDTCFNILDIKPANMGHLNEVITAVQCHPSQGSTFAYSSSRGVINMCDLRSSALCTSAARSFFNPRRKNDEFVKNSFIADILNSISDINFSGDGRYIFSRDYLSVKVWDTAMCGSLPVETVHLHEHFRPALTDLFNSDSIFDKFGICCSKDGKSFATGSYNNQLKVHRMDNLTQRGGLQTVDLSDPMEDDPFLDEHSPTTVMSMSVRSLSKSVDQLPVRPRNRCNRLYSRGASTSTAASVSGQGLDCGYGAGEGLDYEDEYLFQEVRHDEKVLHCAWHPNGNQVAAVGAHGLCFYKA